MRGAPRRSLDLLAGTWPSHRNQGQSEEDSATKGQARADGEGSPRRHGIRLKEEISDTRSACARGIDGWPRRPDGPRVGSERGGEADERGRCTRMLAATLFLITWPIRRQSERAPRCRAQSPTPARPAEPADQRG